MRKVRILGSGYAGLFCAANLLADYDNRKKYEISIFDQNSSHQLLQQIHLVCADIKKPNDISFSISDLMKDELKFYKDVVIGVNFETQHIFTANNKEFDFDYVIIALGSSNNFYGLKGAEEYSQSFRSLDDAIKKFLNTNKINLITDNPIKEVYPSSVLLGDGTIIDNSLSI